MLVIGLANFASRSSIQAVWSRGMLNGAAFLVSLSLSSLWLTPLTALLIPAVVVGCAFLLVFVVVAR